MAHRVQDIFVFSFLVLSISAPAGRLLAQPSAETLIAHGDQLLRTGKPSDAEQAYRDALHLDSGAHDARIGLAKIAMKEEKWDDAILLLNTVLDEDERNLGAHYYRGIAHREIAKYRTVNQTHHWRTAERDFEAIIAQDSLFHDVLYQHAVLKRYHGAHTEAIALGMEQIRLKPELPEPQHQIFNLFRYFINSTDTATARAWLRAHPSEYATYFSGEILRREGDLAGAARVFTSLLSRPLTIPRQRVLLSRARVYYAQDQPEAAERFVRQAMESVKTPYEAALVFDDFKYVVSEDELTQYLGLREPEEYRAYFEALWAKRDPMPARSYNVRLAEHYRRLLKAEKEYAFEGFRLWHNDPDRRGDLEYPAPYDLNDAFNDKGLIYIRHGEPADRVFFAGGQGNFGTVHGDVDLYALPTEHSYSASWRPTESWRYLNPRVDFHFTVAEAASVDNWRLTPEVINREMLENLEYWGTPYSEMLAAIRDMERVQANKSQSLHDVVAPASDEAAELERVVAADSTGRSTEVSSRDASARFNRGFMEFSAVRRRMVEESRRAVDLGLTTDRHTWAEEVEPIEMPYFFAAFRGEEGQTEIEVHYALPLGRISKTVNPTAGTVEIEVGYAVHDSTWRPIVKEAEPRRFPTTPDETAALIELFRFSVPPDSYSVALYGHPVQTEQVGGIRVPYRAPDYRLPRLAVSDLLLAERIEPALGPSRFNRGDLHLSPNPLLRFSTQQSVFVYFEIYNLTLDAEDRTRYSVEYALVPEAEKKTLGLFGKGDRPALALRASRSTAETSPVEWAEIDVSKVDPGEYRLAVRVTDDLTGAVSEQSRPVTLYRYK